MSKDDVIEMQGVVLEALPNAMFQVELENVDDEIKASIILKDKGTDLKIKRFLKLKGIVKEG